MLVQRKRREKGRGTETVSKQKPAEQETDRRIHRKEEEERKRGGGWKELSSVPKAGADIRMHILSPCPLRSEFCKWISGNGVFLSELQSPVCRI